MDTLSQRRRRAHRILIFGAMLAIGAVTVLIGLATTAHASTPAPSPSVTTTGQVPGGECTAVGATFQHHGRVYVCVQKPWDDCPRWHDQKPADYHPPASWTPPAPRPCTSVCVPSSAPPSSAPPSSAPPASTPPVSYPPTPSAAAPSTPAPVPAGLPVTGPPILWLIAGGLLLVVAGAALLRFYRASLREADQQ